MHRIDFFMDKTLDKSSPVPLYYQLKEFLLEYLKAGNKMLPTELVLCRHFDVSRPTVRQAINHLVVDGYLDRVKGKGTFVSQPKMSQDYLLRIESFNDEMQQKGLAHRTEVLEFAVIESNEDVSTALNLSVGSKVVRLVRLRLIADSPIVYVDTYLPYELFIGILDFNMEEQSLYSIVESHFGYHIGRSRRTIEAIKASESIAVWLGISSEDPVQYIESIGYLEDDTVFEYTLASYRGDLNKFTFELKKSNKLNGEPELSQVATGTHSTIIL